MPNETFQFIDSLNASNPVTATDPVTDGALQLRGVKTTLLNTFPNMNAAVNLTPTEANYLDGVTGVSGSGNLVLSNNPTFTNLSLSATVLTSGELADARVSQTNVTQHQAALSVTESQISDLQSYVLPNTTPTFSGINLGNADSTLGRLSAGKIAVESKMIMTHASSAYGNSGDIYISTAAPTTEGTTGDFYYEHEA